MWHYNGNNNVCIELVFYLEEFHKRMHSEEKVRTSVNFKDKIPVQLEWIQCIHYITFFSHYLLNYACSVFCSDHQLEFYVEVSFSLLLILLGIRLWINQFQGGE